MKKIFLAAVAICFAVCFTDCKKEDTTPKEQQDAKVVDNIVPGDSENVVIGDEVTMEGDNTAVGGPEVTQEVQVESNGTTTLPAVDDTQVP